MAKKKIHVPPKKVDAKTGYLNLNLGGYTPANVETFASELSSTGTVIGGTIGSLNRKIEAIDHILVQPDYGKKFSLIESELTTLKSEIKTQLLPQLEQSKQTIAKVEEYLRNNASFLTDLLSSEGRLRSIESEVSSLTKRLDKMQSEKSLAWNRTTTVISIIVAIIGTAFGVYFGFLR